MENGYVAIVVMNGDSVSVGRVIAGEDDMSVLRGKDWCVCRTYDCYGVVVGCKMLCN